MVGARLSVPRRKSPPRMSGAGFFSKKHYWIEAR